MTDIHRTPSPSLSITSSPPSSCPGSASATSSTLIATPNPLKLRGIEFGIPISSPAGRGAAKGHLEPHISNLPRRRKRTNLIQSNTRPTPFPISHETLPRNTEHKSALRTLISPVPFIPTPTPHLHPNRTIAPTPKGHLQPHLTNLPRRQRKPPTPAELESRLRAERQRRRCVQDMGPSSGVFVAFDDEEGEGEDDWMSEFSCVVRICVGEGEEAQEHKEGTLLTLSVSGEVCNDNGKTHLSEYQLRSACQFLRRFVPSDCTPESKSKSKCRAPRILITTPRDRPADAMSLASCFLASFASENHNASSPSSCASPSAPDLSHHPLFPHETASQSPIHTLLMRMHDLSDEERGGPQRELGWVLKGEWRGVLSRDGMDFLAELIPRA